MFSTSDLLKCLTTVEKSQAEAPSVPNDFIFPFQVLYCVCVLYNCIVTE